MRITSPVVKRREFAGRDDITNVVISEECRRIEFKAFCYCKNLTSVIVEKSEDKIAIEFDAFTGCKNLVIFDAQRPIYFFKDVNIRRP